MSDEMTETEEQIFEAARRVFHRKGYHGARMQQIADEAEINKAMLHYYYRSKDQLFQRVYQQEMKRFFPIIFNVLDEDLPLDEKIQKLIDSYYSYLSENPKLIQFLIHEMNQNPERLRNFIREEGIRPPESFVQQIKECIRNDRIDDVDPRQLMISIVGLIIFPFMAQTMIKCVFDLDKDDFLKLLDERKPFLTEFILNGINYQAS